MTDAIESSKLAALRVKTDRDLVRILGTTLELGIRLASARLDTHGPLRARVEDIYTNAEILLPTIADAAERRRLENKLERLREFLCTQARTQAVSSSVC